MTVLNTNFPDGSFRNNGLDVVIKSDSGRAHITELTKERIKTHERMMVHPTFLF